MPTSEVAVGDVVFEIVANNLTTAGIASARQTMTIGAQAIANATNSRLMTISHSIKGVEEGFRRLGNTLVGAGGALTGTFTLPLLLGIKSLTTAGVEFETELYRVASLFADARHPVETLTADLKDFAQATAIKSQFSGTEVLQTMYIMGQAGYQLKDIYEATNPVLELATAQQYDLAQTFGIVNAVLKSYNLTSADSEKVVNMLAAAATEFNLSMDDLQNGLKYILPTAKSLDMELSEMLVMLGALTDRGFKGQQAGRIIRDTFSDLIAPVDSSRAILEKYNLELYTNQDAINGAVRAYTAARQQLEFMERGTLGSKLELAELSAEIDKNNTLIAQAKTTGKVGEITALTEANNTLKNTYSMLTGEQKINTAEIGIYRKYVEDLGAAMDNTTVQGLVPFSDVIAEISDSGMTAGEIYKVFGKQSGGAIIALTDIYKTNNDYFKDMMGTVETKLAAQEQAAVQMQSTAFQTKKLTEAVNQLRYEGYEALAPVIREINEWMSKNQDTLKTFVRMLIEGMVPALQGFLGAIQGVITWFTNLGEGSQKAIIGIITTTAIFLAAIGPVLLYIGALSWGTASLIGLGRRGLEAVAIIQGLAKVMMSSGFSAIFMNSSIGKALTGIKTFFAVSSVGSVTAVSDLDKLVSGYSAASRASVKSSIEAFKSASGYTAVGTAATTAGTSVTGFGASIVAILPWLAVVGVALYALYWAWKNNWGGLRDFTDTVVADIERTLENSNIGKDLENIRTDVENQVGGIFQTIEGIIEADGDKVQGGIGQALGGYLRQIVDKAYLFHDAGKFLWDMFVGGLINQPIPDDPTKSMTEQWANRFKREGSATSKFAKEFTEAFTQGDYTLNAVGELEKTNKLIEAEQKRANDVNQTLVDTRRQQNMSFYNLTDTGKLNANYNPFEGLGNTTGLDNVNSSLNTINNTTNKTKASTEDVMAIWERFVASQESMPEDMAKSFEDNSTDIKSIMLNAFNDVDFAYEGEKAADDFFTEMDARAYESIKNLLNVAGTGGIGGAIGSVVAPSAEEYTKYSSKNAQFAGLAPVGDYLYDLSTINKAVGEEKVYDGEMRSLIDIMSAYTPAGMYGNKTIGETALPTVDSIAGIGSNYAADALTSVAAPSITNITNNNTFNITTNVYPKETMNSSEVNKLGDQITEIVEQKLGEKYQSDEVI